MNIVCKLGMQIFDVNREIHERFVVSPAKQQNKFDDRNARCLRNMRAMTRLKTRRNKELRHTVEVR